MMNQQNGLKRINTIIKKNKKIRNGHQRKSFHKKIFKIQKVNKKAKASQLKMKMEMKIKISKIIFPNKQKKLK